MPRIFVSRNLIDNSPFQLLLSSPQWQLEGMSLIEFTKAKITEIPAADVLFFYSKNAVRFAWQEPRLRPVMQQCVLAAMGKGTAQSLASIGLHADFVGLSQARDTAHALEQFIASDARILFLRAAQSKQSIQQHLSPSRSFKELVVYHNTPRTDFQITPPDILVFTSPMNARVYFQHYPYRAKQQVYAIGKTTADALHQLGIEQVRVPEYPSVEALAELVLNNS